MLSDKNIIGTEPCGQTGNDSSLAGKRLSIMERNHHGNTPLKNGQSTAKSPEDMFPEVEIPNDLKAVDDAIREYYGLEASK